MCREPATAWAGAGAVYRVSIQGTGMNQRFTENRAHDCDIALGWIARMRCESASIHDTEEFALWLSADSSHRIATDSMLDMWDDLGSVQHLPFPTPYTTPAANQRNWLAGAVVLAACLVLAIFLWPLSPVDPDALEFRTAVGEHQSFELEDQSILTLNTDSKVAVIYGETLRHIELLRGEAYFEVSRDEGRPFEVDAGIAKVTALGTAFNIYRNDDAARITVIEGVVRVTELGTTGNRPAATEILYANQQLTANSSGLNTAQSVDVEQLIAWQDGKLIADEMPLPELLAQLDRYWEKRVLILDTKVAALTISGVFLLDRPESVLHALKLSHGLEIVKLDSQTLQLLKTSQ